MIEMRLLFVCLGNICRSPAAEAVMFAKLKLVGWDKNVRCDSAGIIGYHSGEHSDARMQKHGKRRGYQLTSISRKFNQNVDFDNFDMIIGMDDQNIGDLNSLARTTSDRQKIYRMTDFCSDRKYNCIPDPYYGGPGDFELVFDLLEDACEGLIRHLDHKGNAE